MADDSQSNETVELTDANTKISARSATGARYVLGEIIGKGGMGEVVGATDSQIGRTVAIKRMKHAEPSVHQMTRFFREAMIQGRLDHPAIVPVYEVGVDGEGRPFFVMKKLAGTTLAETIAGGAPREPLLRAFVDVCLAVDLAHSRNVVHRDLKPSNVMLGDYGEVYVLDWGIARILSDREDVSKDGASSDEETAADTRIGTYGYMAPEQLRDARSVDQRADVYSLGCVLFEILTREPLHPRGVLAVDTTLAGLDAHPSLRGVDVPPELEALCVAATAVERTQRIPSARDLAGAVQRFLDGDRDLARRHELALAHLDAARAAFADGAEAGRATAMREAGRALALDPGLTAAAELVARLMLEPPKTTPPEVLQAIDADDQIALNRNARLGARAYLAFSVFLPILFSGSLTGSTLALIACTTVSFILLRFYARPLLVSAINIIMIAILARMFSPLFLAPGIAAVITLALVHSPTYRTATATWGFALAMVAAVLAPLLAEHVGVLSTTMQLDTALVSFQSPDVHLSATQGLIGLLGYAVMMIVAAAWLGNALWKTQRSLRHSLHLQAWQLGQLVQPQAR
ncbi:MAG TPA: serine/threonine-protein kinase [Kofleriaceae bacterium]